MSDRILYFVFRRLRFPSERVVRRYLAASRFGETESMHGRWLHGDKARVEAIRDDLVKNTGDEWVVGQVNEDALPGRAARIAKGGKL